MSKINKYSEMISLVLESLKKQNLKKDILIRTIIIIKQMAYKLFSIFVSSFL